MTNTNGNTVKDNDRIKTERVVELNIVEKDGILYMLNTGNMQKTELSKLKVPFLILDEDSIY